MAATPQYVWDLYRMKNTPRRCCLAVSLSVAIAMAPSWLVAASLREEGTKPDYLADHLSESELAFDLRNLELVDELKLVEDSQLEPQVQALGVLATSDPFVSGNLAVVGVQKSGSQFGLLAVDVSDPDDPQIVGELSDPGWRGVHNLFLAHDRATWHPSAAMNKSGESSSSTCQIRHGRLSPDNWVNQQPVFSNRIHDVFVDGNISLRQRLLQRSGDAGPCRPGQPGDAVLL